MKPYVSVFLTALGGLLIAGCATAPAPAPKPPPPKAAVAVQPPPPPAPAPTPAPEVSVPITPEAQKVVEALTQPGSGAMEHTVVEKTGFPEALASLQTGAKAPGATGEVNGRIPSRGLTADGSTVDLVEKDWTGLVLVPVDKQFAKLYVTGIQIVAVEAHPLTDGRVRVWTRLRNRIKAEAPAQVACTFYLRGSPEPGGTRFYSLAIPSGETRDVFFVSPAGELNKYTVSVRTADMAQ